MSNLTPETFLFTEEDVEDNAGGSASYAALEVGDYEATLVKVENYDYTKQGKTRGWIWYFRVEGLEFKEWTAFTPNAKWKLLQMLSAFGVEVTPGQNMAIDPAAFIGLEVGVTIDWQTPPDELPEGESNYKEIKEVYALPSDEPPVL